MTEEKKPPKTLFEFIRERIVPINAVIVLAGFVVAALDFLAPREPYLQWLGWALAAVVLGVMLIELIAPEKVKNWIKSSDKGFPAIMKRLRMGYTPSMRSPAWQALAILSGTVFLLGQASAAKASTGGLLASQFPSVATLQASLLGIREDLKDIKETLKSVKQETSSDPRKELMNLGIPWTEEGLENAVRNQDIKAIKLFEQSEFTPQRRNGVIAYLAIKTDNQMVIDAVAKLNLSTDYERSRDGIGSRVGCELLVPHYTADSPEIFNPRFHPLLKATCGNKETIAQLEETSDNTVNYYKQNPKAGSGQVEAKHIKEFVRILKK